jgi:hypothetical protein
MDGGTKEIYRRRFAHEHEARAALWKTLCNGFFQQFIPAGSTVLEIGAGYCEFINAITAARRIALDINPDVVKMASSGVEALVGRSTEVAEKCPAPLDRIFVSNLFEHLTKDDIMETLIQCHGRLAERGRILVLQPNIRYAARDYWMFFDHITPLDDRSLCEALELAGFRIVRIIPRFLPYTTRSRLPQSPLFVRTYLRVPFLWNLFGGQAFVVAEK